MSAIPMLDKIARAVLSHDNSVRKEAEKVYQNLREKPDAYLAEVAKALAGGAAELQTRIFLCIMLRQDVGAKSAVWRGANAQTKAGVQEVLLGLVQNEKNRVIRRHVCEVIGRLASHTVAKRQWDALIPVLENLCTSQYPEHVESGLHIAGVLSEYATNSVVKMLPAIYKVIGKCLNSSQASLQVAAFKATASFIMALSGKAQNTFSGLLPNMFQSIARLAKAENDDALCECIDEIASLLSFNVQMFRPLARFIIKLLAETAAHKGLEPGTRRTALSLIVEFAKKDRAAVKQVKDMSSTVIPLAYSMLSNVNEDINYWGSQTEERDPDDEDFGMGWDTLDYLACYIGGSNVMVATWPLIESSLSSKSWVQRHAAICAITAILEGCKKVISIKLGQLLKMLVNSAGSDSEHVRVRWAAVNCIGHLAVEFTPEIQKNFAGPVLECLVKSINSRTHVRLAAHGALCLVDYCRGCEAEDLAKYAETLLGSLARLLGSPARHAQTNALSAVSAIASTIGDDFKKFYGAFMPGISKLLADSKNADTPECLKLRAKAIECVGVIAAAVGKETFQTQFKPTMQFLLELQLKGLDSDDPQQNAILEACARICQCMGSDFAPYVKIILPPLLRAAEKNDGAFIQDADDEETQQDGFETVEFSLRGIGDRRLVINTSLLQEKSTACHMLYQYASELKGAFFPYVTATAKIMVPLINYRYSEDVRVAAVQTIPALLQCLKSRAQQTGKGNASQNVCELFNFAIVPYLQAIKLEGDVSNLISILHAYSDAIDELPGQMDAKQIAETHQVLAFVLTESNRRRQERLKEIKSADDDLRDEIEQDNELEDEMIGYVGSVIKSICVLSKSNYLKLFHDSLYQLLWDYLNPKCSDGQHTAALIAFCEIIENAGGAAREYAQKFLPICVCYSSNANHNARQAAVYGVGVCALAMGPDAFSRYAKGCLENLVKTINRDDARTDDFSEATDNAISSVGKICKSQCKHNSNIVNQVLPMFLSWMPVRCEEEGPNVHSLLLDFVEDSSCAIHGKNNENLPKIFAALAEISESEFIDQDNTQPRLKSFVRNVATSIGTQGQNRLLQSLSEEHRAKIRALAC